MKLLILLSLLLLPACDTQFQRRTLCTTSLDAFCAKNEKCGGGPWEDCVLLINSENLCTEKINSSSLDIKECIKDLNSTPCDVYPVSCMGLR